MMPVYTRGQHIVQSRHTVGHMMDELIDKTDKGLAFRLFRVSSILIFAAVVTALISMLFQGWLLGGVSFQQTSVGGPLWYIALFLRDLVYPST